MIVLDTNVLSELMRNEPSRTVQNWLARRPLGDLWTTSISQAEILFGLATMPPGRRRDGMQQAASTLFNDAFEGRIFGFDSRAAPHFAGIMVSRRRLGRPVQPFDAAIAAIARANGVSVATRDTADFGDCGIVLHDPWQEESLGGG